MINLPMTLDSFKSLRNNCMKLVFETQDIAFQGDQISKVLALQGKYLQVAFVERETEIEATEIEPLAPIVKKENKSQSSKLRDKLFILHKKMNLNESFEDFYDSYMNRIQEWIIKEINKYE